jgi:hypothetical protein
MDRAMKVVFHSVRQVDAEQKFLQRQRQVFADHYCANDPVWCSHGDRQYRQLLATARKIASNIAKLPEPLSR